MPIAPLPAVVVVDDHQDIRTLLTLMIQGYFPGHPVYACQTTAQACAAASCGPVACVVTDYDLGRDDGRTLAQALHMLWPDLPIILLTGLDATAQELGTGHYVAVLTKPIVFDALRTVLQAYLHADVSRDGKRHNVIDREGFAIQYGSTTESVPAHGITVSSVGRCIGPLEG